MLRVCAHFQADGKSAVVLHASSVEKQFADAHVGKFFCGEDGKWLSRAAEGRVLQEDGITRFCEKSEPICEKFAKTSQGFAKKSTIFASLLPFFYRV